MKSLRVIFYVNIWANSGEQQDEKFASDILCKHLSKLWWTAGWTHRAIPSCCLYQSQANCQVLQQRYLDSQMDTDTTRAAPCCAVTPSSHGDGHQTPNYTASSSILLLPPPPSHPPPTLPNFLSSNICHMCYDDPHRTQPFPVVVRWWNTLFTWSFSSQSRMQII